MAQNKTQFTDQSPFDFLQRLNLTEAQLADAKMLISLMEEVTGMDANMYGDRIIGVGKYQYKYPSGHSGEAPLLGFSPSIRGFSLYISLGRQEDLPLIEAIGPVKSSKACIYVKSLKQLDIWALQKLMKATSTYLQTTYTIS